MCLSTNEEPRTERVVNQIYVTVAGYNETINRGKRTCINNLKYQEHQNKYIKISWEKKYDSISDYCSLHHPLCWDLLEFPHHITYLQTYTFKDYVAIIFPFSKKKKEKSFRLGAGRVLFLITLWTLILFLWIIKLSLLLKQDTRREDKLNAFFNYWKINNSVKQSQKVIQFQILHENLKWSRLNLSPPHRVHLSFCSRYCFWIQQP